MEDANSQNVTMVNGIPLPSRRTRKHLVVATLLFCWSIIAGVLVGGNGDNSLHASALSWAFSLSGAVVMMYVFGAVVDNWGVSKSIMASKTIK